MLSFDLLQRPIAQRLEESRDEAPRTRRFFQTARLGLNQRVVAVWKQSISRPNSWDGGPIPIEVADKGLYLVEAAQERLTVTRRAGPSWFDTTSSSRTSTRSRRRA